VGAFFLRGMCRDMPKQGGLASLRAQRPPESKGFLQIAVDSGTRTPYTTLGT
jgi:hypothetical protein